MYIHMYIYTHTYIYIDTYTQPSQGVAVFWRTNGHFRQLFSTRVTASFLRVALL